MEPWRWWPFYISKLLQGNNIHFRGDEQAWWVDSSTVFREERPCHYLLCVIGNQRSDMMEGQSNCVAWGLHNQWGTELANKPMLVGREGSTWGYMVALPPFWSRDLQKLYLLALLTISCFYFPFSFIAPHLILRLSGILVSDSNLLTWFLNQWLLNYKFEWFLCFHLFLASQHFSSCIHFFFYCVLSSFREVPWGDNHMNSCMSRCIYILLPSWILFWLEIGV